MEKKSEIGISIIIPLSNRANLLDNTLNSYKKYNKNLKDINYEIIILSQNTTDNLQEIINKHSDLNIIRHNYQFSDSKWINPALAFNIGMQISKYDKIALTSPEIMHETNIIEQLWNYKKYDAVLCKTIDIKSNGSRVDLYSKINRGNNPGFYFFGIYNKEKFKSIGGLDLEMMKGEGWDDTEFGERWLRNNFTYELREDLIVAHQYHPRISGTSEKYKLNEQRYLHNKNNNIKIVNKMKICGFLQVYNELNRGNLKRCLNNMWKYCDYIVVFDDASTDDSVQYCKDNGCKVLKNTNNSFNRETFNKDSLLNFALKEYKDITWFLWLDADEILNRKGVYEMRTFCYLAKSEGYSMPEINLWRSDCWHRQDYLGDGVFNRLWKNNGKLYFKVEDGLHKQLYPNGIDKHVPSPFKVIHYGYANKTVIERRWVERTRLGVPKNIRIKCIQEEGMKLIRVSDDEFPIDCMPIRKEKPIPIKYGVS